MKRFPLFLSLLLSLSIPTLTPAADDQANAPHPDVSALAQKLVAQCARVKEADIVQISGGARDVALLQEIAVQTAKLGGDPLLLLSPDDATGRRLITEVPARYDSRTPPSMTMLAERANVIIGIDSSESDSAWADIPAARIAARIQAVAGIGQTLLKRNVRQVNLGNGIYPTDARAKSFGMTRAQLSKLFYSALDVDYDAMRSTGLALQRALSAGHTLHITSPSGTDLTVDITARHASISDGILSDDRVAKGGTACQTWLPAGEVYLIPVPGTAQGKVVVDSTLMEGKEVRDLTLTFSNGKMTSMTAEAGLQRLKAFYDSAGPGKDDLSIIDFGINPAVPVPAAGPTLPLSMAAGMVSLSPGFNLFAGGDNNSTFFAPGFIRSATVTLDAKPLITAGKLQLK